MNKAMIAANNITSTNKGPIFYALTGSVILHAIILISYGAILISKNPSILPKLENFKIEFIKRPVTPPPAPEVKPKSIQRVKLKGSQAKLKTLPVPSKKAPPKVMPKKTAAQLIKTPVPNISSLTAPHTPEITPVLKDSSQKQGVLQEKTLQVVQTHTKPRVFSAQIPNSGKKTSLFTPNVHKNSKSVVVASNKARTPMTFKSQKSLPKITMAPITHSNSRKVLNIHKSKAFSPSKTSDNKIHIAEKIPFKNGTSNPGIANFSSRGPRSVPEISDPKVLGQYLANLQILVEKAKKYPKSAKKFGREGKVTVKFTLMADGKIKDLKLLNKSEFDDLNLEAINAIKRSAPFSPFPEMIGKPYMDIVLPFWFKISE